MVPRAMGSAITRKALGLALCGVLGAGLSACSGGGSDSPPDGADLVAGKRAFLEKCGTCHTMDRAGTKGTQGPDLDAAFEQALDDGFGRGGIRGIVAYQIEHPNQAVDESSPAYMPADLVRGDDVYNVAAYVAFAADKPGQDTGSLFGRTVPSGNDGKTIFSQMCRSCHTLADARTSGTIGPNLDQVLQGQNVDSIKESIVDPNSAPSQGYARGIMPDNYARQLRPEQVDALSAYLAEVAGQGR